MQIPDSFKDHVYIPHGDHVYVPLSVGKRRVRGEAQSWPVMKSLIDHFVPVCVLSLPGGYQEHATLNGTIEECKSNPSIGREKTQRITLGQETRSA